MQGLAVTLPAVEVSPVGTIIALAALILALGTIIKTARFFFRVDRALPILLKIAQQFEEGESLKKRLDDLALARDEQIAANKWTVKIAEDSRLVATTNAKIVEELTSTQTSDLISIRDYVHSKMHEVMNRVAVISTEVQIANRHNENIERRLDNMIPLLSRHRKDDNGG